MKRGIYTLLDYDLVELCELFGSAPLPSVTTTPQGVSPSRSPSVPVPEMFWLLADADTLWPVVGLIRQARLGS
ncbi:MAG: hypothetical protein ABSD31_13845 [Candidatus Binataceae bacterium]